MRLRTPISLAIFAVFLSGCALQPTYQRPESPVAASYPRSAAYPAKAGSGPVSPAAAGIAWRDNFRDPRLQRLVELALQNNRDLRVAILNIEKVKAQYQIQRASLFPQVNIASSAGGKNPGATGATGGNTGTSHSYAADFSVSWEADFFGHLHNLSDAAFEQYIASSYARKATEILLVSQVVDQYLAVLAYGEQRDVTQQLLQTAQASYKLAKLQFDVGTLSELDLRLSQTAVEQAQANYAAQTRLQAQAGNALVLLVGQPLPADLPAPAKLRDQSILADIPPGLPSDLLENRPDILQAEAILRSENANIGAARAAFFPQIALTGSLGTASSSLGGLFAAGSGAWSFLPTLLAPIFDAGANQANLDAAKVQKDIGIAQYQKAVQTAFREVSDGLAARATYDEQLAAQQRYTNAQARRLELENMLYAAGSDSYLNVLLAQNDLYNAQQSLITTQLNRLTSLADLYRSLGGGWKADAAPVRQNATGSDAVATEETTEGPSRTGS